MRFTVLLAVAGGLLADDSCPRVVPDAVELYLPASLPAGMRAYVAAEQMSWVFCDGQGAEPVSYTARATGNGLSVSTNGDKAGSETYAGFLGRTSMTTRFVSAAIPPADQVSEGVVEVTAAARAVRVPIRIAFTDEMLVRTGSSTIVLDNHASGQQLDVWFENAKGPVSFTATTDSAWLSVNPASGVGFTALWVQADFSKLQPGGSFANVVITAPGALNSPHKVIVRALAEGTQQSPTSSARR